MGDTTAELRARIAEAITEIDPVMRYDSPLLTGRRALADRAADAVLPVVASLVADRDALRKEVDKFRSFFPKSAPPPPSERDRLSSLRRLAGLAASEAEVDNERLRAKVNALIAEYENAADEQDATGHPGARAFAVLNRRFAQRLRALIPASQGDETSE